jgi:hypothetical protein
MPENYADWEFSISGNPHELLELSRTRGTDYFRIGGGIDYQNDCHNDDYRLTTMFAQDESDAHIVWQVGYELVGLFNGASWCSRLALTPLSRATRATDIPG